MYLFSQILTIDIKLTEPSKHGTSFPQIQGNFVDLFLRHFNAVYVLNGFSIKSLVENKLDLLL